MMIVSSNSTTAWNTLTDSSLTGSSLTDSTLTDSSLVTVYFKSGNICEEKCLVNTVIRSLMIAGATFFVGVVTP